MTSAARTGKPVPPEYVRRWKHSFLFAGGWLPVPQQFLQLTATLRPKISRNRALLLLHLMSFKWADRSPFVKYETLAKRLGVSAKQVARDAQALERDGYLVIEMRRGRSNTFHLDGFLSALNEAYWVERLEEAGEQGLVLVSANRVCRSGQCVRLGDFPSSRGGAAVGNRFAATNSVGWPLAALKIVIVEMIAPGA